MRLARASPLELSRLIHPRLHPVKFYLIEIALQVRSDCAGHQRIDGDAVVGPSLGRLDREKRIRRLGSPIRRPRFVGADAKVDVVKTRPERSDGRRN